ncbi:hypothetical protein [Rhizobium halophytocola]|uniref:Uncharacterized protein n=1 Tax=Rhizobium halophytocola TaxID=735519 RepID=A0ABS4DVH6_9HYPH|nr:hypothetical protein [Rhizobium halophytocola]MBP1849713.1 hypothetical protein [Rhizobium halophytocola]
MNEQPPKKKIAPPEELSTVATVKAEWARIIKNWQSGWHEETGILGLENYVESERLQLEKRKVESAEFDWDEDWIEAKLFHDRQMDFVRNRRALNEGLVTMWREWYEQRTGAMIQLSLEALRSMILLNGAAILASLTLLSGQIAAPTQSAVLAAKVMLLFSILSILINGSGHLLGAITMNEVTSRIRGVFVGHIRHAKLYAISRYLRRHLEPRVKVANGLIYSSIFIFAVGAAASGVIIVFNGGPP